MPALNNYMGYAGFNPYQNTGYQFQYPQQVYAQQQPTTNSDGLIYVHGIEGANAYQIPSCCNNFGYNTGCGCSR